MKLNNLYHLNGCCLIDFLCQQAGSAQQTALLQLEFAK